MNGNIPRGVGRIVVARELLSQILDGRICLLDENQETILTSLGQRLLWQSQQSSVTGILKWPITELCTEGERAKNDVTAGNILNAMRFFNTDPATEEEINDTLLQNRRWDRDFTIHVLDDRVVVVAYFLGRIFRFLIGRISDVGSISFDFIECILPAIDTITGSLALHIESAVHLYRIVRVVHVVIFRNL